MSNRDDQDCMDMVLCYFESYVRRSLIFMAFVICMLLFILGWMLKIMIEKGECCDGKPKPICPKVRKGLKGKKSTCELNCNPFNNAVTSIETKLSKIESAPSVSKTRAPLDQPRACYSSASSRCPLSIASFSPPDEEKSKVEDVSSRTLVAECPCSELPEKEEKDHKDI